MSRPGTPYDQGPDATQPERPMPRPRGSDPTELERQPPYQPGSDATQLERPPPYPPRSDATQLDPSTSHPPGWQPTQAERPLGAPPRSPATELGRPPPYQPPPSSPGYPPGTSGYGAPPYGDRPGVPVGPPPSAPGGGYPPPVNPPTRSRRGLFLGIAAALLVLLAVAAAVILLTTRNKSASNAPGSQLQGVPPTASNTSTTPATVAATSTVAGAVAVSSAPALSGAAGNWTDPENRVTVRFPADWQKDTFDTRDENGTLDKAQPLLQLTGPDRVRFSVTIYVSTKTLDEDVQSFRNAGASDPKVAFKPDPTQDATVGGERARLVTGTYTQSSETVALAVWFVDHGGKRFGFTGDRVGTHRGDIDTIVGGITFVPAGAQVTATPASTSAAATAARAPTALATTSSLFGTPAPAGAAPATSLTVTLKDTSFTLSPTPIQAGSVPIAIQNTGTAPYTVEFHGSGVNYVSPAIPPGQTLRVSLTFPAGTYTIVCNVPRPLTGTLSAQ